MNNWMNDHLAQLVGGRIIDAWCQPDEEGVPWPFLVVAMPMTRTEYTVVVQCDPEGNGPGHLDIVKDFTKP